ncbi:hypothetical protein BGZ72_007575 [Mortierella alpina]|nr:hypothetical protein BGZ72_007575 [Mortierella alpina]
MSLIEEEYAAMQRRAPSLCSLGDHHDLIERQFEALTTAQAYYKEYPSITLVTFRKYTTSNGTVQEEIVNCPPPSLKDRIVNILFKPFHLFIFALVHIGLQLVLGVQTIKTLVQVLCLRHLFPVAPELVRILRQEIQLENMAKLPKHLAVILPAGNNSSEREEDKWAGQVAHLAQWAVACGIKCLSIMRTDPLHPELVVLLQERITDTIADFYAEEKVVPVALVRTLCPLKDEQCTLGPLNYQGGSPETTADQPRRLHGGRVFDLDVVVLSKQDGHDRLAECVQTLGESALQNKIKSEDITMEFMDKELSYELSEPELLIIFKNDLDLSSYPPWHIRLTEIFHHPDQAIIPQYTMFLQALHWYAKCDQRFGK